MGTKTFGCVLIGSEEKNIQLVTTEEKLEDSRQWENNYLQPRKKSKKE
jgi:hypothetical protein